VADDGYEKARALKKEQFVNQDLAEVFRNMQMLGISFEDLQRYYHQFIKNN
jgi:DNA-binding transcriptional regulator YhcF (GntR family)